MSTRTRPAATTWECRRCGHHLTVHVTALAVPTCSCAGRLKPAPMTRTEVQP